MKKLLVLFLVVIVIVLCSGVAYAATTTTTSDIKVRLDGQELTFAAGEAKPVEFNGRVLVPMRKIFEAMDIYVDYDNETRTIKTQSLYGELPISIVMQLGNKQAEVNGSYTVTLDAPPKSIDRTTYVPLRFIAETAYCDVNWNADSRTIEITKQDIETLKDYVAENIPQQIQIGDQTITIDYAERLYVTYMFNEDPYPYIYLYINDEDDIDYLVNAYKSDEIKDQVCYALGRLPYACSQYYHCNAAVVIRSTKYGTYEADIDYFSYDDVMKTTYNIKTGIATTEWYYLATK